jgi:hypothetical protein
VSLKANIGFKNKLEKKGKGSDIIIAGKTPWRPCAIFA